jgi:nitric oxide dioxygenase
MEDRQVALIRESWQEIGPRGAALADAFYARLFAVDPRIRDLFAAAEMESQSTKFVAMLAEVVRLVQDPERFAEILESSGRRHAGYGVTPRHYRTVGEALLWALDRALPGGMDAPTREAWSEAYTRMAFIMQRATA